MVREVGKGQGSQKKRAGGGSFCPPSGSQQTQQEGEGEMSRLIRDTDIIRKLNNLIEAINTKPDNVFYGKEGLLEIVNAIIGAVSKVDEAYDVEAVVRELEDAKFVCYMEDDKEASGYNDGLNEAIEIVRGGRK